MKNTPHSLIPTLALLALSLPLVSHQVRAEVHPHALFSDGAVLQQGVPIPVWGTAREGEQISVEFAGQTRTTTAKDGKWKVEFPAMKPGAPQTLTIKGDNTFVAHDILIGEVWLASGQSNMELPLESLPIWATVQTNCANNDLRMFKVKRQIGMEPLSDVTGQWSVCTPQTAGKFSAVGYFFGRDLQAARKVPVGIINSSKGGTWAQAWVSLQGYESSGDTKTAQRIRDHAAGYPQRLAEFPAKQKEHDDAVKEWRKTEGPAQEKALKEWKAKYEAAIKSGQPFTDPQPVVTLPMPKGPEDPVGGPNGYSALFNGMIAPLAPYPFTGVAWYQGESNSSDKGVPLYEGILGTLVKDWRRLFGKQDLPFLIVQLPGHKNNLPGIRIAQLKVSQKLPPAAVIVTADLGNTENLHPVDKEPVGARLSLAARAIAYGEKIPYSGPLVESAKLENGKFVLSFSHVDGGLVAKGGDLRGFEVAGADKVYQPAKAVIAGDTIVVSSDQVPEPKSTRYNWTNIPTGNLFNAAGLPASLFEAK